MAGEGSVSPGVLLEGGGGGEKSPNQPPGARLLIVLVLSLAWARWPKASWSYMPLPTPPPPHPPPNQSCGPLPAGVAGGICSHPSLEEGVCVWAPALLALRNNGLDGRLLGNLSSTAGRSCAYWKGAGDLTGKGSGTVVAGVLGSGRAGLGVTAGNRTGTSRKHKIRSSWDPAAARGAQCFLIITLWQPVLSPGSWCLTPAYGLLVWRG